MDSKKRTAEITLPRMVAMYLIRENTDLSLQTIGKLFGGRHCSSVIHAVEKIGKDIKDNSDVRKAVEEIQSRLGV